ncbi:murein L,D-transpeptidase [Pontibacter sp. SGAir0037]|uniref:L,D-transpeptidase family protein n=1 Tax=Pontibacter sp. SGAir0037 TaxID=2571030 RepID=UPI001F0EAEAB|nr:L,D-transpeptidase family protein [Pontibacter sp. SGAir0037]
MKPTYLAALCLLLLATFGCNRNGGDGKNGDGSGGLFGSKSDEVKTDSLFIKKYISNKQAFKEQEELVYLFYGDRDYTLGWFKDDKLVPQTERFLEVINRATKEGLDPKEYKVVNFEEMFKRYDAMSKRDTARHQLQQEIDVALTASYFNYASDFYTGRINPSDTKQVNWNVRKNKIKLHKALQTILKERESTYPYYEFEALHDGYVKLREALQTYRALQEKGGWPKVELGASKSLKKGDTAEAVLTIRKRLNPGQQLDPANPSLRLFDDNLDKQVKQFQRLHGLAEDGVVGGNTLKTMNVSIEDRIDQIMINMERWRWIPKRMVPKKLDQKYVWVNIPEYKLYIYEDPDNDPEAERQYKKVEEMRVIVGKTMHSTPIFSEKMEYVVMAPYWNVPNSIVANEIKPAIMRDPNYLNRNNMEIVTKDKANNPISQDAIDWASVTEENFPYLIRQKPGPKNSLGSIKFLFPNEYSVYLHDTPADALFSQTDRNFSHGCVRVERPVDLGTYVLKDMPEWNAGKIQETINGGEETWVTLPKPIQVYLVYFTSWVDDNGNLNFREDIYGHDKKLENEFFS